MIRSSPQLRLGMSGGTLGGAGRASDLELERAITAAEEARASMRSFLNLVVHELRSPLTVISGYLDMLESGSFGQPPPSWEGPLGVVGSKTREMQKLVGELLLAARLEDGTIPCAVARFDLGEAALSAAGRSQALADMMRARLDVDASQGDLPVEADREYVDRILDNLLNNALAHSGDSPRVHVVVSAGRQPSVAVEDSGPGIPRQYQERVFERFFTIGGQAGRPGTGLGLHISRHLAAACGGSLDLDYSEEGRGSRFVLRLRPARTGRAAQPAAAREANG